MIVCKTRPANNMRAVLLLLTLTVHLALSVQDLSSTYQFNARLHEDYALYWSFDNDAQNIQFAVHVRTTGWIGFGLSPNGQMPQSDVVIGWVDGSGRTHFDDRFADTRSLPPVDDQQNWFLVSGREEGGYTTLEFTRNFTSCDTRDRSIKHETAHVLWSWNDNDPVNNVPSFHQFQGVTSLNLLGGLVDPPQDPPDAQTFSITVNNITIPNLETTYWCTAFRIPEEFDNQTAYITKISAQISQHGVEHVHHLLIYTCDLTGVDISVQGPCHQLFANTATDRIPRCIDNGELIGAWAIGSQNSNFYPSNVAFPIGGPEYVRHAVIQVHYDNPRMVSGVQDSSGLIFTYTRIRREHDAGILMVGHQPNSRLIVPPNTLNYSTFGSCSSDCTKRQIPAEGIHVFGNFLHTHTIGSGLELSLLRQNDSLGDNCFEEVQVIDRNLNYDFDYQQFVYLPREVIVMPGDTFFLRCIYKSLGSRNSTTLGGESTQEEMCLSFVLYYPKVNLQNCLSQPLFHNFSAFINESVPQNLRDSFSPIRSIAGRFSPFYRSQVKQIFDQLQWTPEQVQALENNLYSTDTLQDNLCSHPITKSHTRSDHYVPKICKPQEEPNVCSADTPASAGSLFCHVFLLASFALVALLFTMI